VGGGAGGGGAAVQVSLISRQNGDAQFTLADEFAERNFLLLPNDKLFP